MPFEYFISLFLLFLIALVIKKRYKITVFQNYKQILIFYLIILGIGTLWDNFAVWRGHWFYPGKGIVGFFIGLVPIEDYAFAIITSYVVLVLYKALQKSRL